jgi:cation transport ATPase
LGLLLGAIFYVLNQSVVGHWIWFLTLIIGGIPVVWVTIKGIIHRHFASDLVAMLAIIAAILTNEALPGVVIVIMQTGGKQK